MVKYCLFLVKSYPYFCIMDISTQIKTIRESKRIRLSEVADALGVDVSNYAKQEKRGDKLSIEQLKKIAVALGVSLNELLGVELQVAEKLTEDTEGLKKRIGELEELYASRKKEQERLRDYFTEWLWTDILSRYIYVDDYEMVITVKNVKNDKLVFDGTKRELIQTVIEYYKIKKNSLSKSLNTTDKEIKDGLVNDMYSALDTLFSPILEPVGRAVFKISAKMSSDFIGEINERLFINGEPLKVIASVFDEPYNDIVFQYDKREQTKVKAVNYYFYIDYPNDHMLRTILKAGIVEDEIILTSFKRCEELINGRIEKGYAINEYLEIVKERK